MRQRGAALALLLCLTLTACGGQGGGQASFLGEAAGLDEEHPLLTVDGREVPAWRYLYWLASACDQIRTRYQESGLTLDWRAAVDDGTLADYAKSQALADTALYATVENWAEEYGCELTEADQALLESSWSQQTALQSAALAALGLDRSRAEELWTVGLLSSQLGQWRQTAGRLAHLAELAVQQPALPVEPDRRQSPVPVWRGGGGDRSGGGPHSGGGRVGSGGRPAAGGGALCPAQQCPGPGGGLFRPGRQRRRPGRAPASAAGGIGAGADAGGRRRCSGGGPVLRHSGV